MVVRHSRAGRGRRSTQDAGSGEIRGFVQHGWRVSINSRAPGLGFSLPQRLTAERDGRASSRALAGSCCVEHWQSVTRSRRWLGAGQAQPDAAHRRPAGRRLSRAADGLSAHRPAAIASRSRVREDGRDHPGRTGPAGVPEAEDLVVRAARALQAGDRHAAWAPKSPSRSAFRWAAGWAAAARMPPRRWWR